MRFRRRAFSFVLGVCLSAPCAPAFAQILPGQWVDDLYMVRLGSSDDQLSWALIDERDNALRIIPSVRDSAGSLGLCQSCGGSSPVYWHGGAMHALARGGEVKEDGRAHRLHAFAEWRDGGWSVLGTFKTGRMELLNVLPCDEGRFIAISYFADLLDDRRPDRSPFCRLSLKEGREEFRIDASIDHGQDGLRRYIQDEPRMDPSAGNGEDLLKYTYEPGCFKLAAESSHTAIMTEGRATIVNQNTGLYWVFSTEKATLVKAGSIFKGVTPEMVARGGFRRAVLCANPEKSGTVLLSAQDEGLFTAEKEDAHREADALYKRYENMPGEIPHQIVDWIEEQRGRRLQEIKGRSPLVVWYRIHPENGRVERLPAPPEGGDSFRGDRDYWRPMLDGSVKMGWTHLNVKMPVDVAGGTSAAKGEGASKETGGAGPDGAREAPPPEGEGAGGEAGKAEGEDKGTDEGMDKSGGQVG